MAGPLNVYELVQQARAVLERPGGGLDSGGPHPGALTKRRGDEPKEPKRTGYHDEGGITLATSTCY